jgi:LysR family transcriptional activator of mexEF-oprN operon
MNKDYDRNLDLNLLRVFLLVAETGSVTAAARRLYLTQPAVSAALRRLSTSVGAPLFVRSGRGIVLTERGRRLVASARHHLEALVDATLSPGPFDPKTTERTVRMGLSDSNEAWLLPRLLRTFAEEAPRMRFIVVPVQFRTVVEAFAAARIDLAVTVADELPPGTERRPLFVGRFVCLFDPRHAKLGKRPTLERYLAHDHVIVSYNGDLRGIVEDTLRMQRRVRVSLPSFQQIGAVVEGTALLATIPDTVARDVVALRPRLKTAPLPFSLGGGPMELIWRSELGDDQALRLVLDAIVRLTRADRE